MTLKAGSLGVAIDGAHLTGVATPNATEWSGVPGFSVQTLFVVTSGSLPPGVTLAQKAAGTGTTNQFGWKGVPTAVGVYTATIGASGTYPGDTFQWTISLVGGCPLVDVDPPSPLDDVLVGQAVSVSLTASNGVAPYAWDVAEWSALPDGLTLSAGGVLEGIPTTAGDYEFTIRATDDNGCPGVTAYALSVLVPPPIVVDPETIEGWARNVAINIAGVTASGGIGAPYTFAVTDGALPDGVTLRTDGAFRGYPRVAGIFVVTIEATDGAANTGDREYTIVVSGLRIEVGGVDKTIEIAAADLELGLNRRSTGQLTVGDGYIPARGRRPHLRARRRHADLRRTRLRAAISAASLGRQLPPNKTGKIDLVDYSIFFDDADPVTLTYDTPQELEDVIVDIVTASLAVYGITYAATPLGITVPAFDWGTISVPDAFKRITDSTGLVFRVLPLKALDVFVPGVEPAPVTITDANINAFDLTWHDRAEPLTRTPWICCAGPAGNAHRRRRNGSPMACADDLVGGRHPGGPRRRATESGARTAICVFVGTTAISAPARPSAPAARRTRSVRRSSATSPARCSSARPEDDSLEQLGRRDQRTPAAACMPHRRR
jgi:hypothetical protein